MKNVTRNTMVRFSADMLMVPLGYSPQTLCLIAALGWQWQGVTPRVRRVHAPSLVTHHLALFERFPPTGTNRQGTLTEMVP
jgi:hypothetical protein